MTAAPTQLRVIVDRDRCTGLGLCESFAPEVFEVQDDGSLSLLQEAVGDDLRAQVEQACESCPTEALRIET